ncbi:hypothetical protein CY34DRAFT_799821 [Suillus luteus UH-Slu-Lm8-n1]|uniref:Unplaced genomic scaffold CY34scaffold_21, whole genome shotgun sequence n=1 Tax=Suillus luteus UH-Slu-Lm8-n1 TaxID=930992 RepID=A0A0D0BMA2_9AGAM|nr:hypothetical protein CY34DRAFT_799821 [Suillus luteus UH-Slu-Lm8-n1]
MPRQTSGRFPVRRRQFEVTSRCDENSINRRGSTQEPRVSAGLGQRDEVVTDQPPDYK